MQIVKQASGMREIVNDLRKRGKTVGFVPTMGALHEGHLSLLRRAADMTDHVVMSLFVNPTQFGPSEDFEAYPRDTHRDMELAQKEGAEYVFMPDAKEMYPEGYCTFVSVGDIETKLCGRSRPTFFRGVATVVTKLFSIVRPDFAFFGEKDAQQLVVVKRLVRDLNLSVEVVGCPIVREPDGLAMSSRNLYLNPEERTAGTVLNRALKLAEEAFEGGERDGAKLREILHQTIATESLAKIDYAEVVDPETLEPIGTIETGALCAVAAFVGKARLIDNIVLSAESQEAKG